MLGEKLLDKEIGELMVSFLLNAELVRPRVLPIAPALMELVKLCDVLVIEFTTTFTDNTQVPPEPAAPPIVPPVRVREVAPGLGENVPFTAPVPVQLTLAAGVEATTMPMGRVSTNVVSGIVVPLLDGLVSVMFSVTGSPTSPGEGENDLLPVGGLSPRTDNAQVPPEPVAPPIVPPVRVRDVSPGLGENVPFTAPVPVQLTLAAGVGATIMPRGRVSTNVVSGIVVPLLDGLVSVIVSVTGSPTSPGEGENDLLPVGGLRAFTPNVALAGVVLVTVMTFSVA